MKNRIFLLALMVISLVHYGSGLSGDAFCAGNTRIISDMDDMRLEIPANPVNIACLHCVSPERIMILGEGARISFMSPQSPWAYKLFPEINRAETRKRRSPEQMKADGVDLALFSPGMDNGKKLRDAGLNTVCAFSALKRPMNIDQFKDNFKRQITMFGDILGPKAQARARRYNEYFQKKVNEILAITSRINKKDRPRVWYGGRGGSMMNTQGFGSVMHWEAEIAGADFLPARLKENYDKATMEQIRSWDPEFVFLSGYCESSDMVTKNRDWSSLNAVKKGNVYRIPRGVFTWDHASGEGPLLMIYMAITLHPDLFRKWDMVKEMKAFYCEVYGKKITDGDAERILKSLPPM